MWFKDFFSSRQKLISALLIITFLAYVLAIFNGFVWDDEEQIVSNLAVQALRNIPQHFLGSTFSTGGAGGSSGIYYKPLMSTSFTFLYVFSGGQPWLFHLFQVLMHCANVLLAFLLLNKIWYP